MIKIAESCLPDNILAASRDLYWCKLPDDDDLAQVLSLLLMLNTATTVAAAAASSRRPVVDSLLQVKHTQQA